MRVGQGAFWSGWHASLPVMESALRAWAEARASLVPFSRPGIWLEAGALEALPVSCVTHRGLHSTVTWGPTHTPSASWGRISRSRRGPGVCIFNNLHSYDSNKSESGPHFKKNNNNPLQPYLLLWPQSSLPCWLFPNILTSYSHEFLLILWTILLDHIQDQSRANNHTYFWLLK